jgi:hypothetical protein
MLSITKLLSKQKLGYNAAKLLESCICKKKIKPIIPAIPVFNIIIQNLAGVILCTLKEPGKLSLEYLSYIITKKKIIDIGISHFMLLYKDGTPLLAHSLYSEVLYDKNIYFIINEDKFTEFIELTYVPVLENKIERKIIIGFGYTNVKSIISCEILESFNMQILARLFYANTDINKEIYNRIHNNSRKLVKYNRFYKYYAYFYNKLDTLIWDGIHINYISILDENGNFTIHNLNQIVNDIIKDFPAYLKIDICKPNGYLQILTPKQLREYYYRAKSFAEYPAVFISK